MVKRLSTLPLTSVRRPADTRSKYVNQLIAELCDKNGTDVTVTEDRLFMFEPIYKMLSTHGWDFFEAKIPERAKALLPLADIKKLFDRHYDPYVNGMKTAMESAKGRSDRNLLYRQRCPGRY